MCDYQFFINLCLDKSNDDILKIKQMISDTKGHKPTSRLSHIFCFYDMNIVERDFSELLKWENSIHKEYESFGEMYKQGRIQFLESCLDKYPNNTENLLKLIDHVKKSY